MLGCAGKELRGEARMETTVCDLFAYTGDSFKLGLGCHVLQKEKKKSTWIQAYWTHTECLD